MSPVLNTAFPRSSLRGTARHGSRQFHAQVDKQNLGLFLRSEGDCAFGRDAGAVTRA
jgi:hypothetical protein